MSGPSAKSLRKFMRKQSARQYRFIHGKRLQTQAVGRNSEIGRCFMLLAYIHNFRNTKLEMEHETRCGGEFSAICIPTKIVYERGQYRWYAKAISLPHNLSMKTFVKFRAKQMRALWRNRPHPLDTPLNRTYKGALRAYILHSRGKKCEWCGCKNDLEIDHITPWRLGGETTVKNAQVLCKSCNTGKYHLERMGHEVA